MTKILGVRPTRRSVLKGAAATGAVLATPSLNRAWAADPVEITMLGWYGTAEPDMVAEFEAENNVKFVAKYYAGGDNMLAALAQNPPGTFDLIHTDAEFAKILTETELVDKLNPADYPFDDVLHEDFANFSGHWKDGKLFSLITRFGHLGVSYNKERSRPPIQEKRWPRSPSSTQPVWTGPWMWRRRRTPRIPMGCLRTSAAPSSSVSRRS